MLRRLTKFSTPARILTAAGLLTAALALEGCRARGRSVRKEAPPIEFASPLAPTGRPGMTLPEIRAALQDRRGQVKSAQAAMTLAVGSATSRGRQQFDASVYYRPATAESPELLRVRGSADAGPVFDFLLNRNEVQTIVYPERKFYRGSLADLRMNPQLLAGVQPDDLAASFLVERTLLQRIRETPEAQEQETPDHYLLTFQTPGGLTERFSLRKADLLVDQVERLQGEQPVSSVRYYGYRDGGKGGLIPTRYDATTGAGAELNVTVGDVRFNASAPEGITRVNVPEGFERLRF